MVFILLSRTKRSLANVKLFLEMISKGIMGSMKGTLIFMLGDLPLNYSPPTHTHTSEKDALFSKENNVVVVVVGLKKTKNKKQQA